MVQWAIAHIDSRIKSSLAIAKDQNIEVNIIEEEGDSIGEHPNCAYLVAEGNGRHIEALVTQLVAVQSN